MKHRFVNLSYRLRLTWESPGLASFLSFLSFDFFFIKKFEIPLDAIFAKLSVINQKLTKLSFHTLLQLDASYLFKKLTQNSDKFVTVALLYNRSFFQLVHNSLRHLFVIWAYNRNQIIPFWKLIFSEIWEINCVFFHFSIYFFPRCTSLRVLCIETQPAIEQLSSS